MAGHHRRAGPRSRQPHTSRRATAFVQSAKERHPENISVSGVVLLQSGKATARLLPSAGGRISALRLQASSGDKAIDVLYPYPEDFFDPLRWGKGGIYPLMPYSNRIAQARVRVADTDVALAPHPDAFPHTLHGNAHALPWQLQSQGADHAVMVLDAASSPAWPWHYTARMELQLSSSALSATLSLRNADQRLMPAGLGLHPYFRHQSDAVVGYRPGAIWPPTPEFIAVASRAPLPKEIHMPARTLRAGGLTDYIGGWDGKASVELPEGDVLHIDADPVFSHLVVHRPDALTYLCLEPVSHVADGFNLAARGVFDTGTQWLAPGESLTGTMRFSVRQSV
jgi:aldose 1-epimerase